MLPTSNFSTTAHSPDKYSPKASAVRNVLTKSPSYRDKKKADPANPERVHIIGVGNVGKLFAHALATKRNPPPITLLFHRKRLLDAWEEAGKSIEIVTNGMSSRDSSYDIEVLGPRSQDDPPIQQLIVSTKATQSVAALWPIRHRLDRESTIVFAQNGMGAIDEVATAIWPEPRNRPRFAACVTTHGIYSTGWFSAVHAGKGTVTIGSVHANRHTIAPDPDRGPEEGDSLPLIQQIVQAPKLAAREASPYRLELAQYEKLAVNAMINPLSAIFNRRNGELFESPRITILMELLLYEVGHVIRCLFELDPNLETKERFSNERLKQAVLDVAKTTAENTSSMLQDMRAGKRTEIDYINNYIVRRGELMGIGSPNNRTLCELVRQGRVITPDEIGLCFPDFIGLIGFKKP